jgi:hypothetical protein
MEKPELAKIAITSESDAALNQALEKVNKDTSGGRVTKTELASWFVHQTASRLTDDAVEEIRMAHFNQITYLEGLLKTAKQTGRDSLSDEELIKLHAILKQRIHKNKLKIHDSVLPKQKRTPTILDPKS